MREFTTPGEVELIDTDHLVQPIIAHAQQRPDAPLLAYRDGDRFVDVTSIQVWERIRGLAKGLIALGVEPGDRVALMSSTRIEWVLLDYAILAAGAVTVPIYETSSAEQVEWILSDSEAVAAVFESDELRAESYDPIAKGVPTQHVLVLDAGAEDELHAKGADLDDAVLDERLSNLTTADMATLIYTSGTTGRPKGCVLTHGNLRWDAVQSLKVIHELVQPGDSQLLFLPLAHVFAKILTLSSIETGAKVGFATSIDKLQEELPIFQPTFLAAVPRVFEKVLAGAQQKAAADGKGSIFDKATDIAIQYSREEQDGSVGLGTKVKHTVLDKLVYGKVRAAFGGRLRAAVSGGGPLGERLAHFFNGVGVQIYEGYGLTETSPVLTCNSPAQWRIGTVGKPIPGTTVRIADDSEILARGGQIFQGYYNNEEATREAVDEDGWFHTGDLGSLDDDGFLRITGRKKEIIVTAAGKNVAPAPLEDRVQSHRLVSQAMVIGDNRKFISCLVTIDEEAFPTWAEEHGKTGKSVADLTEDEELRREVQGAVDHANKAVSHAEAIKKFVILPEDFTVETGELTPTMKVKRRVVEDKYGPTIEDIYA
ncbi:MAG: long-chain fatty acid--CoA ligase [Actinobacteria bacterium]|nr:long-chain fatty acid--CoA ligase [Actinomycetota bacterium]